MPFDVSNSRYHGYQFHSRLPCVPYRAVIRAGGKPALDAIDAWLRDSFRLAPEKLAARPVDGESRDAGLARSMAHRMLALYEELLTGAGVPCFGGGTVAGVQAESQAPATFAVQVALGVLDNLPPELFADLFGQCVKLVQHRLAQEPDPAAAKALLDEVQSAVIEPLKARLPFWGTALPVYKVAHWEDVPCRHLGNGIMRLGWGARSRLFWQAATEGDSAFGARLCANKWQTARVLRDGGLPGAINRLVRTREDAVAAARDFGWPVVVKPNDQEQSAGVAVGIGDEGALLRSFDEAAALGPNVLVERHAPGLCYRLLVAGGRLIYAVSRVPKSVVGNGTDSVRALIETANRLRMADPPWKRITAYPDDEEAGQVLAGAGLTFDSIPEKGQRVLLRPITSGDMGGWSDNLTAQIHPDNARLAVDAAALLGVSFAGVDLITTDITRPWHETGAVLNEVNFNPQFMTFAREKDARTLMAALIEGDGRIPVHLVTGEGDLLGMAERLRSRLATEGGRFHLTGAKTTTDPDGTAMLHGMEGLFERSLALVMRGDVGGIILAGTFPEAFAQGLAVDRLEQVYVCHSDRARGRQMMRAIKARTPLRAIRLVEP